MPLKGDKILDLTETKLEHIDLFSLLFGECDRKCNCFLIIEWLVEWTELLISALSWCWRLSLFIFIIKILYLALVIL